VNETPANDSSGGRLRLLADCAQLARRLAPERCWRDPGSGESCAWYHGFWPYLRLLDYGSSPELHKAFYLEALAPPAAVGRPVRVLISGAADFAMLEVAQAAFAGAEAMPQFTVVDRCDTPLALCRWYAERQGFHIDTAAADILSFAPAEPFDAIATHSFLGNFDEDARAGLLRRWFALLRPGGRLATVNRIRPAAAPSVPFSDSEAASFIERLTTDLERLRDRLDCPPSQIAAMAEDYLRHKQTFPVRDKAELAGLFEAAGFTLHRYDELAPAEPPGQTGRPAGPTMPGGATYMGVIALRPA
jgi:SAM-dependent methyltransferase